MHSLSLELAETSDAIARTMAEAAAASLFAAVPPPLASSPDLLSPSAAVADLPSPARAEEAASGAAGDVAAVVEGDGPSGAEEVLGGGRSRAEAQAEVDRLKARQSELFDMIQEEKEVSGGGDGTYIVADVVCDGHTVYILEVQPLLMRGVGDDGGRK